MTRIKVAVRVRPLSNREVETGSTSIIAVEEGKTVAITNTKVPEQNAGDSRERVRRFTFDYCFHQDSTQDHIFQEVEKVIGQSIKRRFHSCVLAYGQSSSGKTHTMMGFPHDPGLTPKLCNRIFGYLQETAVGDEVANLKVTVSYLEIYNEKVRDLLRKEDQCNENSKKTLPLKVREHPKKGPYVQGLSEQSVSDSESLLEYLEIGNKQRRVAATLTNPRSSRSHSVFSISCDGVKLHLIDLAGSERSGSKCYGTLQFREGANINKSLVALGNVISALAEQPAKQAKGIRRRFVPYRDSVLTWLLKDTLGGNSNTVMVATVSPSSACYSETVNTLRFGQRAKLIVSHPVVNEDPKEKTIRELRAEIARLRDLIKLSQFPQQLSLMLENDNTLVTCDRKSNIITESELEGKHDIEVTPDTEKLDENSINEQLNSSISKQSSEEIIEEDSDIKPDDSISEELTSPNNNQSPSHGSDLTLVESENISTTTSISETTTEKLLPLLKVSSSINPTKPTRLRRTFSVDHSNMNKQKQKMFGSEESIPSTSTVSKTSHSSSLDKEKSQESISRRHPESVTPSLLQRRRSLNKPNPVLPKPPLKRRSLENNLQKPEKPTTTDGLNAKKVESKVNSIRKQPVKPRSHIVAAVTSRLYSKVNKKEATTNTDDINTGIPKTEVPKEPAIRTNARLRLMDITKRALRAHRQRHEQTQTDQAPVLRVKEISTDVDDLKVSLEEVKDAETEPFVIETKDASVNCSFLDQFSEDEKKHNNISFTRSCGTQSLSENTEEDNTAAKTASNPMSFTKYLRCIQDAKYEVSDVLPNTPIYTKTVNINISHNYISENGNNNGSISDDSIEQVSYNVGLPTPDLISNHNSLEQGHDNPQPSHSKNNEVRLHYANAAVLDEYLNVNAETIQLNENKTCTVATCTVVPRCSETVHSIDIEKVQAPQICLLDKFEEGFCRPLLEFEPELAKPKIVDSKCFQCDDCIVLEEPLVLKSIVKQIPKNHIMMDNNSSSSEEDIVYSSDLPDSLDYHMANTKKVKFNRKHFKPTPDNGRMLNAMSEFLEEATNLMNNLTMATSKIGSNNLHLDDSYEFEVTVNDARRLLKSHRRRKRSSRPTTNPQSKNDESQTDHHSNRSDCSTQYEIDYLLPINKYEALVEESCRRLEDKINKIPTKQQNNNYDEDVPEPYFGYNSWERGHHGHANDFEDSSLESNPVAYSDYGSLPRKTHKRQRTPVCSPSAFLKQLTNMRRQIIESSREEFHGNSSNH